MCIIITCKARLAARIDIGARRWREPQLRFDCELDLRRVTRVDLQKRNVLKNGRERHAPACLVTKATPYVDLPDLPLSVNDDVLRETR